MVLRAWSPGGSISISWDLAEMQTLSCIRRRGLGLLKEPPGASDGLTAMTNLDSMIKCRDITLLTKVHIIKAIVHIVKVFPVVMYRYESWTIKKAEHMRN